MAGGTPAAAEIAMGIYLWVALGSAVGGVARFALTGLAARWWGESFPWGTLLINVTGSFAIGFLATLATPSGRGTMNAEVRQVLMSGVLGGFTTFSAFSLQTLGLLRTGEFTRAGSYVLASVLLSLAAAAAGHLLARALAGRS